MDPATIAAIISAGSGLIKSANSENNQQQIAAMNYQNQQREGILSRMLAERALQLQLDPQTDARGNTTSYGGPGVGFQTKLSDTTDQLTKASDRAELQRLTQDEFSRSQGVQQNFAQRQQEGNVADALLTRLMQPSNTRNELQADLHLQNRANANAQIDGVRSDAMLQALRSGVDPTKLGSQLASARTSALGAADANAVVAGREGATNLDNTQQAATGNLYNLFASRAGNFQDTPFRPNNVAQILAQNNRSQQNTLPQASALSVAASRGSGGRLDPTAWQYNKRTPLALGSLASSFGSIYQNSKNEDRLNSRLGNE